MTEVVAGALGEIRGGTSKGVNLSTTAAYTVIPAGTRHLFATPRNLSTAVVAGIAFCPYVFVFKTQDAGATTTDYTSAAQDGSTTTSVVLSGQGDDAAGDFLYVGSHMPFSGAVIDVDSVNANTAALTVKYWDGTEWADISATDGTAATGATLAQDGAVTWTIPTDWTPISLIKSGDIAISGKRPGVGNLYYWTRWEVDAALDAATTLDSLIAIPPSASRLELVANQQIETAIQVGPGGFSAIVGVTDAGTADLLLGFGSGSRFP